MTEKVALYLGISGANYGMCTCQGDAANLDPTCNSEVINIKVFKCNGFVHNISITVMLLPLRTYNLSNLQFFINSTKFQNGFWPGDSCGLNNLTCWDRPQPTECVTDRYSTFLTNLNNDGIIEATWVFSMWSTADDILANSCLVYDYPTPHIPNSHCVKIFFDLTHMQTKEDTVKDQYRIVTDSSLRSLDTKALTYCARSLDATTKK